MSQNAIRLSGDRQLRRQLARLTGPQLRRVTTKGLHVALRPMLRQAKRLAPRETGRLRASLGVEIRKPRGGSLIIGRLGPRRDVRYTVTGGVKRGNRSDLSVVEDRIRGTRKPRISTSSLAFFLGRGLR